MSVVSSLRSRAINWLASFAKGKACMLAATVIACTRSAAAMTLDPGENARLQDANVVPASRLGILAAAKMSGCKSSPWASSVSSASSNVTGDVVHVSTKGESS
jgi:hypothetical protein